MHFQHSNGIWAKFPELAAGALFVAGITKDADPEKEITHYQAIAEQRLSVASESELPEIQAWRRTFSKMGLKPTQYRCASESLLRRFRKERSLPRIHPLIDVCNALSLAYAIPIAVFDVAEIDEYLEVRQAAGAENYLAFSGEVEHPEPDEVVFADATDRVHARRWTNRQSLYSAVSENTSAVLIVAEAMHESAADNIAALTAAVTEALRSIWSATAGYALLSEAAPRFEF
ncbi:B3/4 domain-containing protein [Nocardia sp. BMG51109]|uniref:B3/B4 domain-containing protein n=1 Tax=Nocardia sp. BMG51109 TaxID=1056816 RepID=UPI0004662DFD|nr:phenylalanine--tRNA ligase beta subunit-related protein [Nocardia sp. BMG51109]